MSRCDALNERKSRREGRANFPGAHPGSAGILACLVLGNDLLTETSRQGCLRSQDACAPRIFALTLSMRPIGKTRQTSSLPYTFRRKNGEETNNARRAVRIRLGGRRSQERNEETE